ncbi:TRA2B family protein [Megaselia abdita]
MPEPNGMNMSSMDQRSSPAPKDRNRNRSHSRSHSSSRGHYRKMRGRSYSRSRSRSPSRYYYNSRRRSPSRSPHRHRAPQVNRENPQPTRCIGIFGLDVSTNEHDIRRIFEKYGPIDRVQLVIDAKSGQSRGFCFVYFENLQDAKCAKEHCSGMEIGGRRIRVDYSITSRAHTPTPGVYMGRSTQQMRPESSHRHRRRRTPSPPPYRERRRYYRDRSRSRSYSPSPRRYR